MTDGIGTLGNEHLGFWANVLDGENEPRFSLAVETETGKPIALVARDRETLEPLMRLHIPPAAASSIGQALMLGSSMKAAEQGG